MRRPPGPRNARDTDETRPNVTRSVPAPVAAAPKDRGPDRQGPVLAGSPGDRGGAGRVDADDRKVTVGIHAGHGAPGGSTVGKGDGDLRAAEVMGVGQDLAVSDDDAGSTAVAANADDGRAYRRGHMADGIGKIGERAHVVMAPGLSGE